LAIFQNQLATSVKQLFILTKPWQLRITAQAPPTGTAT